MVRSQDPSLQIGEDKMDHGQVRFALVGVAIERQGFVRVAKVRQSLVANPSVSAHGRSRRHVALDEATQLLGTASGGQRIGEHFEFRGNSRNDLQAQPTGIDEFLGGDAVLVRVLPLGGAFLGILAGTDLDGSHDASLVMHAFAFTARLAAHVALINLNWVLAADGVTLWADHASAELVQDLEGSLVPAKAKLALELKRGHARRLRGHEVRAPKPRGKWRVGLLHDRASGERYVPLVLAGPAAEHHRAARGEAVGLGFQSALGAGEAIRPAKRFEILCACVIAGENALKLGNAGRKASGIHNSDGSRRNETCQLTV